MPLLKHVLMLIVFVASFLLSKGLSLKNSSQYLIQLDKDDFCGVKFHYAGYNNLSCLSGINKKNEGQSPGPILIPSSSSQRNSAWRQWAVNIKKKQSDGSYLAVITNYLSRTAKPKCVGSISIATPTLCNRGIFADKVFINEEDEYVWRIIPLTDSSDVFVIVANNREPGCFRYLGATVGCNDNSLKLYYDFDGSGLQRWRLIPLEVKQQYNEPSLPPPPLKSPPLVKFSPPLPPPTFPPPSPPPPFLLGPGKPSKLDAVPTVASTVAILTWVDAVMAPGSTVETYQVRCVVSSSGCSGPLRGNPETGISRGTQQGQVTGLSYSKELKYSCFVVAQNAGGEVCSDGIDLIAPDAPTNIVSAYISQSTWMASWDVGAAGYPEEVYSLKCVRRGAGCDGPPLGVSGGLIERWVKQGSVLTLPLDTSVDCYVVAENSAGRVCSAAQPLVTPKRLSNPLMPPSEN